MSMSDKLLSFLLFGAVTGTIYIIIKSKNGEKKEKSVVDLWNEYIEKKQKKFLKTFPPQTEDKDGLFVHRPLDAFGVFKKSILQSWKDFFKKAKQHDYYNNNTNYSENIEKDLYEIKWYEESISDENNPIEKRWKTNVLIESTSQGNVIMFYDVYRNGFAFYSDCTIIDKYLNAVAMEYVLKFKCRDFFVDETLSPVPSPLIQIMKDGNKEENKEGNKKGNKEGKNIHATSNQNVFIKTKRPVEKGPPPVEKIKNKFIKMGKIDNFSFIQRPKKVNIFANTKTGFDDMFSREHKTQTETFSYKDYKKKIEEKRMPEEEKRMPEEEKLPKLNKMRSMTGSEYDLTIINDFMNEENEENIRIIFPESANYL